MWFLRESIRWSLEISSVQGFRDVKVLFLAGVMTPGSGKQGAGGLLSEYDRERFQEQKVALAPGRRSRLTFRNFICICI